MLNLKVQWLWIGVFHDYIRFFILFKNFFIIYMLILLLWRLSFGLIFWNRNRKDKKPGLINFFVVCYRFLGMNIYIVSTNKLVLNLDWFLFNKYCCQLAMIELEKIKKIGICFECECPSLTLEDPFQNSQ